MKAIDSSWQQNIRIFLMLLWRDMYVLRSRLRSLLIDSTVLLFTEYITFCGFFPAMGMSQEMIPSIYLGSIVGMVLFEHGFNFAASIVYNIPHQGYGIIEYHLHLPIEKRWLFAEYIVYFMIEILIISLPLITIGLYFANPTGLHVAGNWFIFFGMYLLTLFFFGIFFLSCAFIYEYNWFKENMWARRLTWMFCLGPILFSWQALYALSPIVANIMLINPITFIIEGLRRSLLMQSPISLYFCFPVIIFWIVISGIRLTYGIKKQLDSI